ncbi:hypothetical protein ACF0H5_002002 [Mactra antiquata]
MYQPEIINGTVTNVNKLYASTDTESAIACALKCHELNCTSFTYGEKLGISECYNTTSRKYDGRQSTTNSGTVCQRWDSHTPHDHRTALGFPERNISDVDNSCRDPDNEGMPWCFTVDPKIRWEPCPVKKCNYKFKHDSCYDDDLLSMNYTGNANLTRNGKECQRWDTQTPHSHNLTDENFPEASLSDAENYCRDPTASGYTWCYTTDPETSWETCDVFSCTKYRNDKVCFSDVDYKIQYKGRWDVTIKDIKCQRWDSQAPHSHYVGGYNFPEKSLTEANNYCRESGKDDVPLWCYTIDPYQPRVACEVTKCPKYHVTCYDGPSVRSYMGTWNKTVSGRTCQRWDVQTPHSHNLTADMFEEDRLKDAENFCRDPTNSGELWCYTTDPMIELEKCGIGKCNGEKTCQLFNDEKLLEKNSRNYLFVKQRP